GFSISSGVKNMGSIKNCHFPLLACPDFSSGERIKGEKNKKKSIFGTTLIFVIKLLLFPITGQIFFL
ncbi:MAG: hypothetical protein ABI729_03100, partial [Chitinophagales bacterium]